MDNVNNSKLNEYKSEGRLYTQTLSLSKHFKIQLYVLLLVMYTVTYWYVSMCGLTKFYIKV